MTDPRVARLELELDIDAEPIAGRVRGGEGGAEPFAGWLGLTRAIELRLEGARRASSPPSPPPPLSDPEVLT